jgi:hypothetical protein
VAVLLLGLPSRPAAHDIPNDVLVQAFLKPEGQRLRLLVRAPLSGMLDVEFPIRGPGYLDLARANASFHNAANVWIAKYVALFEGNTRLASPRIVETRLSLPSDRSFASYDAALAHVMGAKLPADTELYWNQGMLDVLFEYSIQSDRSQFSIDPQLARLGLRVTTVLQFLPPTGVVRAFEFHDEPGLVRLDPRWHQAALRFTQLGFSHILDGIDHLLFLFCLVLPFRQIRTLIVVVTSFTVAHSITLIASAFNLAPGALWFPPLVEMLIAMSIVYMALENIFAANPGSPTRAPHAAAAPGTRTGQTHWGGSLQRRWLVTFAFGLVHGFGFSFALRETLQLAGSHLLTSLLSFNVGVELGQIFVLLLLLPMLAVLFRRVVAERIGIIILSAFGAHTGWHWMIERGGQLSQYQFQWPVVNAAMLASAMRGLMLLLIAAGLAWLLFDVLRRLPQRSTEDKAPIGADE